MGLLTKLDLIYEGYKNVLFPTPQTKEMAQQRAKVCAACPHMAAVGGENRKIAIACMLCGCVIAAKTASPKESCPIGKWKEQ